MCHLVWPTVDINQCSESTAYAWNLHRFQFVFVSIWFFKEENVRIKINKNTNGGAFIIVVCFQEDFPDCIQNIERDNSSTVGAVRGGVYGTARAVCKCGFVSLQEAGDGWSVVAFSPLCPLSLLDSDFKAGSKVQQKMKTVVNLSVCVC